MCILAFFVCILIIQSCQGGMNTEPYDDFIANLEDEKFYAFVSLEENAYPVLLVADGVYECDDIQAAFYCSVYYVTEEQVALLGSIRSEGTAYPISSDKTGLYTMGHHYVKRYIVDEEQGELVLAEYAEEVFQEGTGAESYFYAAEDKTKQVEDRSVLEAMAEKYFDAEIADFCSP